MEFYEVLENRHSVRTYQEKEIEAEKLRRIIDACKKAPSAGNLQAYKIYVVKSQEAKESLARAALDQEFIAQAPIVLVFCADKMQSEAKYGERGMELYAIQDATIAAAYAQLAVTAEGLSCAWVGAFEPLEVSFILKAEPGQVPVALIPIGYAAEKPGATSRRPREEMVKEV